LNNKEIKRVHGTVFKPEEKGRIYKSQEEGFARVDPTKQVPSSQRYNYRPDGQVGAVQKLTENHYPDPQERVVILG